MDKFTRLVMLVLVLALPACAYFEEYGRKSSLPLDQQYERQPWARVPVQQAYAECVYAENLPAGGGGVHNCMRAKGYFWR